MQTVSAVKRLVLLRLPISCLSASLSLCQPINLRARTVTRLSRCREGIFPFPLRRKGNIALRDGINQHTTRSLFTLCRFLHNPDSSVSGSSQPCLCDSFTTARGLLSAVMFLCLPSSFLAYLRPHSLCDLLVQKTGVFRPAWTAQVENRPALSYDLAAASCLITAINRGR